MPSVATVSRFGAFRKPYLVPNLRIKDIPPTIPGLRAWYAADKNNGATLAKDDFTRPAIVSDSFNRADGALGNADSGQAWTITNATWGLVSGQVKALTTASGYALADIDAGIADVAIQADIVFQGLGGSLAFRVTNGANFYIAQLVGTQTRVYKCVGGAFTQLAVGGGAHTVGVTYTLRVEVVGSSIKVYENGVLVITLTDATYTTQTRHGLYVDTTLATTIDNFSVAPANLTQRYPGSIRLAQDSFVRNPVVTDSFNRADGAIGSADTGQAWTAGSGTWSVVGGKAQQTAAAGGVRTQVVDSGLVDVAMQADIAWGSLAGLVFRYTDGTNYYVAKISQGAGQIQVSKFVAAAETVLGSAGLLAGPTTLRVENVGSSIKVYQNGTLVISITDTTYTTQTKQGLWIQADLVSTFDNFSVTPANLVTGASTGGQPWTVLSGTWKVANGAVVQTSSTAETKAVIDGGSPDVSVSLTTTGPVGGTRQSWVVLRAVDDNNCLIAGFFNNGADTVVVVYKDVAGVYTQIGSNFLITGQVATRTLRVDAIGSSIKVWVDGTLCQSVTDSTYLTQTRHGIRTASDTATTFQNFQVLNVVDSTGGQSWQVAAGTGWGITQGKATTFTSVAGSILYLDEGAPDMVVSAKINGGGANRPHGLVARYVNSQTYFLVYMNAGTVYMYRVLNNLGFVLGTQYTIPGYSNTADYVLSYSIVGANVVVYVDGVQRLALTLASDRTVTDLVTDGTTGTVTSLTANFTGLDAGRSVVAPGVPGGAFIASVTNATTAVLNVATTAAATVTATIQGEATLLSGTKAGLYLDAGTAVTFADFSVKAPTYLPGQGCGTLADLSGLNNHAKQVTPANQPLWFPGTASDPFTRADGAMGSTTEGHVWTAIGGGTTTYAISGNKVVSSAIGGGAYSVAAVIDAGFSDGAISADLTRVGADVGMAFRVTDINNLYLVQFFTTDVALYKRVAGGFTLLATTPQDSTVTRNLRVVFIGSSITVFVDGVQKLSVTDSTYLTPTRHGLLVNTNGNTWDNFSMTNSINGKAFLRQSAAPTSLGYAGSSLPQPFTSIVVAKTDSTGANKTLLAGGAGSAGLMRLSGTYNIYAGVDVSGGVTDALPLVMTGVFNSTSSSVRANGTVKASGDAGAGGYSSGWTVGGWNSGVTDPMIGMESEITIYAAPLTASQLASLERGFGKKYAIPVA